MEDMGKLMIKCCGGLPLAVKVLGGLLATKHTLREWKRVYDNIGSCIVGDTSTSSVNYILSLSYEELPMYLKHCFLYFAHFPEDITIEVGELAYKWAAEGIPRPSYYEDETIREVADGYIEELVMRNMVISKKDDRTSRFETCQLHDVMREVCLRKAEEENFVQIVDATATSQSPCNSRRLAVHQVDDTSRPKWEMLNPKLRSLLFYKKGWDSIVKTSGLSFKRVQLMRLLDLSYAEFEGRKLPSSIGKLIHLRYLNLYCAKVSHLPSSIRNLRQLLYFNLDVRSSYGLYMAPNFLNEMRELTYLSLPRRMHYKVRLELGNLVNLETLELGNLFNMRRLENSKEHNSVRDLHRMTRLETLHINTEKYWTIDMPELPEKIHFPSRLTTLSLWNCRLTEDQMPILGKLLHLKEVNLRDRSLAVRRMVCSGSGFPQLQKLFITGLTEWEEWIVEEGSMPLLHTLEIQTCPKLKRLPVCRFPQLHELKIWGLNGWDEWIVEEGSMPLLHTLNIWNCPKLKELPDGLQFIYSLKELNMDPGWKDKLSEGGEEYYKVQHIPLVLCD